MSVLAPYWLERFSSTPGLPMMSASPNFGATPSVTVAKSRSLSGVAAVLAGVVAAGGRPADSGAHASTERRHVERLTAALDKHPLVGSFDETPAAHPGRGTHRRDDVAESQIARVQLARLYLPLQLPLIASVERCPGNPGNREQPR